MKKQQKKSKIDSILSYIEYIVLVFIAAALAFWLTFSVGNFFLLYSSNALSTQLLQFAGVLFGLLLTAYAILLGLVPAISKIDKSVLDTDAFKKSHLSFVLALLMTLAMIIVSFSIIFATGNLQQNLIYVQLLLLFFVLELAIILTIALGFLFRYVTSRAAKGQC